MRKLFKTIMIVWAITACIGLTGCKSKEKKAEEKKMEKCLSSIQKGLENRWKLTNDDTNDINKLHNEKKKGIAEELKTAKTYENTKFKDKKFEKLVRSYVEALKAQGKGIDYEFTDSKQYENLFNKKGYDVRSKDLKKLVNDYKLEVDSKYKSTLKDVIKGDRRERISIGDNVTVNTQYGKVELCIDEFTKSTEPDKDVKNGDFVELLRYKLHNISFDDGGGYVALKDIITVKGMDGYNIDPYDCQWEDGSQYAIDSYMIELPKGQSKRTACPYILSKDTKMVYLEIGNQYDMILKVEK